MGKKLIVTISQLNERHREAIREAAAAFGYSVSFYQNDQDALEDVRDAEIIFASSPCTARYAEELKWFCASSAGVNNYLIPGVFASPHCLLTSSSGAYGVTISEHIVMVTLELMRRQPEYMRIVSEHRWDRGLAIRSIKDCDITLLGTGDIGRETAERLKAFSPKRITGINRSGRASEALFDRVLPKTELDAVLPETQLLIISLPSTGETDGMIDARRLSLLPDGAIIVNVGRGSVIDQKALESELRSGRLQAALDVFEQEPIPAEDTLWDCPNLILTPHIAGNMTLPYTVDRIVQLFLENFEMYCKGQPMKRLIDFSKGY